MKYFMKKIKYYGKDEYFMDWIKYNTKVYKIPNNFQTFRTVREYYTLTVKKWLPKHIFWYRDCIGE